MFLFKKKKKTGAGGSSGVIMVTLKGVQTRKQVQAKPLDKLE